MKKNILIVLSVLFGFFTATIIAVRYFNNENDHQVDNKNDKKSNKVIKEEALPSFQSSFKIWNQYIKNNIDLMSSFQPQDEKGKVIGKENFLAALENGLYLPESIDANDIIPVYQLTPLHSKAEEKIQRSIKSLAKKAMHYFKMEGSKLPEHDFISLKGKSFNEAQTKGKLMVIKCWFITCRVCVEEFPELNELVDKYKERNVVFVSLAFDEKDKLQKFLKTKEFKYATIPSQRNYMKKLKLKQYPTHIIVNGEGVIVKMVSNVKTLAMELKRLDSEF
ncbi:MAG TPA: TlpA family protein disulfide reductase [Tenacibaculum sp.]|nr:TlpA family protein disulfide reductase [Tenacibaculum sp.]